jgi:drug/metabolite transporter, DME family
LDPDNSTYSPKKYRIKVSQSTIGANLNLDPLGARNRNAVMMVLFSGFLNSFGGLILRSVGDASEWQIVFYRTGSLALGLSVVLLVQNSWGIWTKVRRIGIWGWICGVFFCGMQTLFIFSLGNTTVANTAFILGSAPILTAFTARLILGEVVGRGTWVALVVAVLGATLMVVEGISTGSMLGDLAAVGAALCSVGFIVILRAKRHVDMLPSLVIGGLLASLISFVAVEGRVGIPVNDMLLSVFWGGILSSGVLMLFTMASRHLKGGVLMILLTIEFFLGPFWVWLFINERPSKLALVGGLVIFCGVAGQAYLSSRNARARNTCRPASV